MATFEHGDAMIDYEQRSSGFPVLLFMPGGMRSSIPFWERSSWNPIEALSSDFRVIGFLRDRTP